MRFVAIIFLILYLASINLFSQETSWSHWTSKEKDIQMDYPADWKVTNFISDDIVTFLSPNKNSNASIPEMITFRSIQNNDNYKLEDLKDYIVNNVIKSENGVLETSENIIKGDIEANVSVANVVFKKNEYVAKIFSFIKNDDIFLLILISFKNNYDNNNQIVDKVFDTLDINF
jgi:hypothetical protein